jgi:MscS family membrane protein
MMIDNELFQEFLGWNLFEVPVWRIGLFLLAILVGLTLKNVLLSRFMRPLDKVLEKTASNLDNLLIEKVEQPLGWIILVVSIYLGLLALDLPDKLHVLVVLLLKTIGTVFAAWMIFRAVDVLVDGLERFASKTESDMDDHMIPLVKRMLRISIICVGIITIVQQWGYDVTSLIAGLGIGGLALALAAQDTLANWFGSIMIFTDRPFKLGDWVKSDHGEGVVEEVGLRSTKIRTFAKTLITVPNKDVANTAVENFSEMPKRRINAQIGVVYSTSAAQMLEIVDGIKDVLRTHEAIDQEFWLVNFVGFGGSSLDIMIYAFTDTTVWGEWLDARQDIYLKIMKVVEDAGSSFAFPSQSIYFENPIPKLSA